MTKILADFHHQALYYSLQLLFENRLGFELYRPIGLDWWNEGYWEVYPHPHTANQFLGLDQATSLPLDVHGNPLPEEERKNLHCLPQGDGIFFTKDVINGGFQKGITFEAFKNTKFDILISSIPQHIGRYNKLTQLYQPQAKHIFQVGNAWGQLPGVRNIMASTAPFHVSPGINVVFYHQEFDLNVFSYEEPRFHNTVNSYVHYMRQPELMDRFKYHFPGWKFTKYGAGMEFSLNGTRAVAEALKDSAWTYHYKPEGDGFGHCYSEDTEILTENGWKLFKDVLKDEKVATINTKNGELEYQQPTDYQSYKYNGKMLHFKGRTIDILVTPNHRMWIERYDKNATSKGWRFELASDMNYMKAYSPHTAAGFKLAADKWNGKDLGITEDKAKLLGWYLSEGCCGGDKNGNKEYRYVLINNTNREYIDEIVKISKRLGYKTGVRGPCKGGDLCKDPKEMWAVTIASKELCNELLLFGHAEDKYIPRELLDSPKNILKSFLDAFMKGDGCDEYTIKSTNLSSKRLIDDLQELAFKVGYRSKVSDKKISKIGKKPIKRIRMTTSLHPKYKHLINTKKLYNKPEIIDDYNGYTYCLSVPNETLVVRRNGNVIVCGNSVHSSYACGRPLIVHKSFYNGKLAADLMIDGQTCIDTSIHSFEEVVKLLSFYSRPEEHIKMCENSYNRFKQVVNFDQDEQKIRRFLERLI